MNFILPGRMGGCWLMKIGIDIGVTNTHAVLVTDDGKLFAAARQATSSNILLGVHQAVSNLLERTRISPNAVKGIFIGTTELLKALVEEKVMAKCALLRIGRRQTKIAPALNWPPSLKSFIHEVYFLESRNRYNGSNPRHDYHRELEPLFHQISSGAIEAVCIVGTYSPMYEGEEQQVKNEIKARFPAIPITVSHQLGSIGFIERENASLLNTLLSKLMSEVLANLQIHFSRLSLTCPIWFTQSNGSLMTAKEALELPALTLTSGVANSLRGAAILSGKNDIIAVDVGGSMINLGKVTNGQLREVTSATNLLGIDASLVMPEFISLPFGGASIPSVQGGEVTFHTPIAKNIAREGMAWGGKSWTVSDSFLKLYPDSFYDKSVDVSKLDQLDRSDCEHVVRHVMGQVKHALDLLQDHEEEYPIVLVGGGSPLLNERLFGKYKRIYNPAGYSSSSAIGACFAPVSEVVDKVYWLNDHSKEEIIDDAVAACKNAVLQKGADPGTIQVSYVGEYPFAYLRGEILRVKTKVTGELIL
jgi:hypothetical protein